MGIERMHFCHPVARIGYERPEILNRPTEISWRERNSSMIGICKSRHHRPRLVTVGFVQRVDRALPHGRVGGRFTGEVSGIEFLEGGVEVVGVEYEHRRNSVICGDLDDDERSMRNGSGSCRDSTNARDRGRRALHGSR